MNTKKQNYSEVRSVILETQAGYIPVALAEQILGMTYDQAVKELTAAKELNYLTRQHEGDLNGK